MGLKIGVSQLVGVALVTGVVLVVVTVTSTSAQLDLPSMPGPPYPDPRGNNRWGVKFDPRKHGPPYDRRGSAHRNVWHRGPPGRLSKGRDRDRDRDREFDRSRDRDRSRPSRERDAYWSPGKMRRHSQGHSKKSRRQNRFYENDIPRRRPRTHSGPYKSKENGWIWPEEGGEDEDLDNISPHKKTPSKAKQENFWKSWNAWYRKQVDAKEQLRKGKSIKHTFPYDEEDEIRGRRPIYDVNAEEFEKLREDPDGRHYIYYRPRSHGGNSILGKASSKIRDFYWTGMKEVVKRAKSLTSSFGEETGNEEEEDPKAVSDTGAEDEEKPEGWRIFTTIGKGLDAANQAMGSVRKTVGGTVLGTGIKYGGKMAMNAVMNVGTSALTTAIQSATLG